MTRPALETPEARAGRRIYNTQWVRSNRYKDPFYKKRAELRQLSVALGHLRREIVVKEEESLETGLLTPKGWRNPPRPW